MSTDSTTDWMNEPTFAVLSQGRSLRLKLALLLAHLSSNPPSSLLCPWKAYSSSRVQLRFHFP